MLNGPLPEDMIDSAILGKLKLEHTLKEGIFVMPKVYYLEKEDETTVSKCKGYSGKLTKAQYLELLSGQTLYLEITKWSKSLRDSYVWIQNNTPYKIHPLLTKRNKILERGKWVNTAPLILS